MITLSATGDKIELETETAAEMDIVASYADRTSTTFSRGRNKVTVSSATDTDISGSPAASTQRLLGQIAATNVDASLANRVRFKLNDGAADFYLTPRIPLQPGESVQYSSAKGFQVLNEDGLQKVFTPASGKIAAWPSDFNKLGAGATEAAGVPYLFYRDTGFPGAWTIGTPGVAGRALVFSSETGGFLDWKNPAAGNRNYLTSFVGAASGNGTLWCLDCLWVNTGLVVTTTTAQTVNSVAFPARDLNGTANGLGVQVAVLVTTATTNAGAITNMTMSYTNSDGTSGRTATVSSFPITCTAGSLIFFQLQAGDRGVQSIQSVTLGTSLVTGAISLLAFRRLALAGSATTWVANPDFSPSERGPGVELFDDSCLMPMLRPASATTYNAEGLVTIEERVAA